MSTTVNSVLGSGCGCASSQTVEPESLAVVPAGSIIVQAPCADGCLPPSSASVSAIQQESSSSNCSNYANPCVITTFQAVAIGKTGTLNATCASTWAMPGLRLFFPGLGYLEVLGVSGTIITYQNLTIEAGTEILAGVCFHADAPGVTTVSESSSSSSSGGDGGEESTTLDAIWGEEGNVASKIVPVNGMMLVACGGKWQRRQAGLMYYPISRVKVWDLSMNYSASGAQTTTVNLTGKPTTFSCSLGLHAVFTARVFVASSPTTAALQAHFYANNIKFIQVNDESVANGASNNSQFIVDVGAGSSTTPLKINIDNGNGAEDQSGGGTLKAEVWLDGYFY